MKKNIQKKVRNLKFDNIGYYSISLIVLALLGFWPTYFSKLNSNTVKFNFYFHFHFLMASLWIMLLIAQPILIKKRKFQIHRQVGKLSLIILPLFFLSVILLKHHSFGGKVTEDLGTSLLIQVKDLLIIGVMFTIAMVNKHNMPIHARAMIATGIVFIEPALGRLIILTFLPNTNIVVGMGLTVTILYILIIFIIFLEREQFTGRWVFPLLLALLIIFHYLIFFQISFPLWDSIASWFVRLPITL